MKKITILIVMALLCPILRLTAQSQLTLKPLNVGDQIPDIVIKKIINYRSPDGKLSTSTKASDFKGRVLILDFWDVWCGGCLTFIPTADSLNRKLREIAVILPVTTQKKETVLKFLANNDYLKKIKISSVVEDKELSLLFPHSQIPHEVWIDPNGKVIAMTYTDYVTEKNIRLIASGAKPDWLIKYDKPKPSFDRNESILTNIKQDLIITKNNQMVVTGHVSGYDLIEHVRVDSINGVKKYSYINIRLLNLYAQSISSLAVIPTRIILNVKDPKSYCFFADSSFYGDWSALHTYSFEMSSPSTISDEKALTAVIKILEHKLNVKGEEVGRTVKCWVLKRINNTPLTSGYKKSTYNSVYPPLNMNYIDPEGLTYTINQDNHACPVIDETGVHDHFDLKLKSWPKSLAEWNKELEPFGLIMNEGFRNIPMFVLSEVKQNQSIKNF